LRLRSCDPDDVFHRPHPGKGAKSQRPDRWKEEVNVTTTLIGQRIGISQMQVSRLLRGSLEQLRVLANAQQAEEP
jgi:hypothetical protein